MGDWYKASLARPLVSTPLECGTDTASDNIGREKSTNNAVLNFTSRRSPVLCRHAAVATSQPLASAVGYDLLRSGANAADVAVAVAAALAVLEPCSTGLGGDAFCLYYSSDSRVVSCLNGSGRSPTALTLDHVATAHPSHNDDVSDHSIDTASFRDSALALTVPGAAAAWEELWLKHGSGKFTFADLLEPAAIIASEGFPVAPITSYHWKAGRSQITKWWSETVRSADNPLTNFESTKGPKAGEIAYNHDMATVLRQLGKDGARDGFYCGKPGQAIVEVVRKHGGCLTLDDMSSHQVEWVTPISTTYHGCHLWQAPPNGQGVAGLIALAGLQHLEDRKLIPNIDASTIGGADAYHCMIEMMRLGFADARAIVSDPEHSPVSVSQVLDPDRISNRVEELFQLDSAVIHGCPDASSCTVSFQVVDASGNAISMVNSNYQGFGTGLVPENCGFTLQNRGFGFNFHPNHPNCVGPGKRPCHTILPALLTHADTNELYATLSNMGGNMQPQGHTQLTVGMLAGGLDPQAAIDFPRFCILDGTQDGKVYMEDGIDESVLQELIKRGHKMEHSIQGHERCIFGRAQIIKKDRETGVLWAGSDGRADGCAMGY
jgi:gamma-glutamyltranspeptidase / glutathione hydrolase